MRVRNMILQSTEYPFMLANLDGVIKENGELVIFEAKTASAYKQSVWEEGVPPEYVLQIQHYMAVTGAKKTYIAALVGGNQFFWHEIFRDDAMIEHIIAMEKQFWEYHVQGGVEPVIDGSKATTAYINEKFEVSNGNITNLPEEVLMICEQYDTVSQELKELETAQNAIVNQLKNYMKEYEIGTVGNRKIVWKSIVKKAVDTKRLKEERPDIYEEYLEQSHYRRFTIA